MSRRRRQEEHVNHERWLVSYADFVTLLFAFFVVMYAISQVNEGKYRVLSEALVAAFRAQPRSLDPIQVGEPVKSPWVDKTQRLKVPALIDPVPRDPLGRDAGRSAADDQATLEDIAGQIQGAMGELIDQDVIAIRRHQLWLEVDIKTSILFPSGSATLEAKAVPVLKKVAEILRHHPHPIQVEGFTDTRPISTVAFPSNWELSAARAASVVHLFTDLGIDPQRMAAVGYGEYRPIADNDSPRGRARNRRVVLQVLARKEETRARRILDIQRQE
jgi:chemotaxis protein MotB